MSALTEEMRRLVRDQRLAFVATVCPDGTPNLSPKGATTVWDGDHLVFADIRSPNTIANLRGNSSLEINVVDPVARKGYRFKGTGQILEDGSEFEKAVDLFRRMGVRSRIQHVVLVKVERALPIVSPAYDSGITEVDMRARWRLYYEAVWRGESGGPTGE